MFVSRGTKNISPFFFDRDLLFCILYDLGIFIKNNVEVIFILYVFCRSVNNGLIGILGLECTEHLVPNDKEHSIIFVKILCIRAVMNPMVRRSGKKIFQYAKFVYCFGVYKCAPALRKDI